MPERFVLQKSEKPGYYVCTDTVNRIVCTFKEHNFNTDQLFSVLDDFPSDDYMSIARFAREMGDWLKENHYSVVF